MPQLSLCHQVNLCDKGKKFTDLYYNNGVIFGVDSYHSDVSIITPSGDIQCSFGLGFEEQNQFSFSRSYLLSHGLYISSYDSHDDCWYSQRHQIRVRSDYEDQGHYEVLYNANSLINNKFAVNSKGHVYIIEDNKVLIWRDLKNFQYEGGTKAFTLETLFCAKNRLDHVTIDDNDTVFLTENGYLKIYNADFTLQFESPICDKQEEYYSILCVGSRLYVCREDYMFEIYDIVY